MLETVHVEMEGGYMRLFIFETFVPWTSERLLQRHTHTNQCKLTQTRVGIGRNRALLRDKLFLAR